MKQSEIIQLSETLLKGGIVLYDILSDNHDCACITTAEMCPLFDNETGDCFLHVDPCDWKIDKIKEGFEKLSTFHYGFTRFDYI